MRTVEQAQAAYRGLSTREAAARLGCTRAHVVDLIDAGALRAINVALPDARRPEWKVMESDLDAFVRERQNRKPAA